MELARRHGPENAVSASFRYMRKSGGDENDFASLSGFST